MVDAVQTLIQQVFDAFDTDSSGTIDKDDFQNRLNGSPQLLGSTLNLDDFYEMDADENGQLNREEWTDAMALLRSASSDEQDFKRFLEAVLAIEDDKTMQWQIFPLLETVEAVFEACDLDGNGEVDADELVARYGKQAGHMLKEFDLDGGSTISKEEFVSVLDRKYQQDPVRAAKWVQFLGNPPARSSPGRRKGRKAPAPPAIASRSAAPPPPPPPPPASRVGSAGAKKGPNLLAAFAAADVDDSGTVTLDELKAAMVVDGDMSDSDCEMLFGICDANKDNEITMLEFARGVKKWQRFPSLL